MKFCSECGSDNLKRIIPKSDTHYRQVCQNCLQVHYTNPKIVTGAIVHYDGKFLLCKRAIEPRIGYWTYPAGFLENNETVEEGAIRETQEESEAKISIETLIGMYSILSIGQVHVVYKAQMNDPHYNTTQESSEVRLYNADQIPWEALAFPVTRLALLYCLSGADGKIDSRAIT